MNAIITEAATSTELSQSAVQISGFFNLRRFSKRNYYLLGPAIVLAMLCSGCEQFSKTTTSEVANKLTTESTIFVSTASSNDQTVNSQVDPIPKAPTKKWHTIEGAYDVTAEDAQHWAFQRLKKPAVPWNRKAIASSNPNPVDQFILKRLEQRKIEPSEIAEPQVLIRRVATDVIGLLPDPYRYQQLLSNFSEEAYQEFVDELLDSQHFGERWGRHWLDLARYADSNGYEYDENRPNAYPYRDFVIYAINDDLPYDEFIRWQIAGDELEPSNPMAVAATGFCTAAPYNTFFPQEIERYDELDDIISTMGEGMLGLTVGCARCHEHKYDPISTADYYGLVSVFNSSKRRQSYLVSDRGREYVKRIKPWTKLQTELTTLLEKSARDDKIDALEFTEEEKELLKADIDPTNARQAELIRDAGTRLRVYEADIVGIEPREDDYERCEELQEQISELEADLPEEPPVGLALSGSQLKPTPYLNFGNVNSKGPEVAPGFVSVLTNSHPNWTNDEWKNWLPRTRASRAQARPRSALANWLTDVEKGAGGLLARVAVNRIWQHYFGNGLVRTVSDFGLQGDLPDHPDLLEWLACELIEKNWSMKHIHRLILNSDAYKRSNITTEKQKELDFENRFFARQNRKRMDAEIIRDVILQLGGNLNLELYGPSIKPAIPREAIFNVDEDAGTTWPVGQKDGREEWRRSVYIFKKRSNPVPFLSLFDEPEAGASCARRTVTTSPPQALALWNEPMLRSQSRRIAKRIRYLRNEIQTDTPSNDDLIQQAYQLVFGRSPNPEEMKACLDFLRQSEEQNRLAQLCHVLLLSNEFIYVE